MNADREPFHYLHHQCAFIAETMEPYPVGPWLASLEQDDLDYLADVIGHYTMDGGEMPEGLLSDIMAVVVHTVAKENAVPSFACSLEQINNYIFALGVCAAFEQMRRAGVVRILSPMILVSDTTPKIELVHGV